MKADGFVPRLPDAEAAYLIPILVQIGPTDSSFGGAITESDVRDWQFNSSIRLQPWQCRALRLASRAWAEMAHEAQEDACPAPFVSDEPISEAQREAVARRIDEIFG